MVIFIIAVLMLLFVVILFFSIRETVKNTPIVISVKNCEEGIECELRKKIKDNPDSQIIAVDLGSTDDTLKILKKLSLDYEGIRVISLNQKSQEDIICKIAK